MCADTGVKLNHLPPYAPDLNPIEDATMQKIPLNDSAPFLNGVLIRLGQEKKVPEAISGTQV
ncbi:hypothetical protein N7512_005580 [Penicillium capsulatum]|nr:hypothetical protein N7512_005580 [Penicillium capsulatum]